MKAIRSIIRSNLPLEAYQTTLQVERQVVRAVCHASELIHDLSDATLFDGKLRLVAAPVSGDAARTRVDRSI